MILESDTIVVVIVIHVISSVRSSIHLRLSGPDSISQPSYQLQLRHHLILCDSVTSRVTSKPTLWTHAHPPQRILPSLTITCCDDISSLIDPPLQHLQIFQFRKLRGDDSQDNVLGFGKVFERLEAAGTWGVVLHVESVNVEIIKEDFSDALVSAF